MSNKRTIEKVIARQIIDSGNPTVEAEVYLADGTVGRGASQAARPPVSLKHWNFVTVIKTITVGKVF